MECLVCMEVRAVSDEKSGVAINAREAAYRRDSADSFPGLSGHSPDKILEDFGGD